MNVLLALTRFVHLGSITFLVGALAFLLLVARPSFCKADNPESEEFAGLDRQLLRLLGWSLLIAVVSAVVWLALQAVTMSGRVFWQALAPGIVRSVLTLTQFGRVWQFRLALLIFFRRRASRQRSR